MPCVLIATNQPILAKGLEAALTAGGLEIADICTDVFELFDSIQLRRADAAILDMSVLPGPEAIRDLRRLAPKCKLFPLPDPASCSPARLVEAINMIMAFPEPESSSPSMLVDVASTAGERAIIALAGYGLTAEEIAIATGFDRATVKNLLRNICDRLGAEGRLELAIYGLFTLKNPSPIEGRI